MGRRRENAMATGITEKNVWHAADALLLEGLRPTIERVRQKIGRGSPNTVQPYLDSWFKGLGARIRDPEAFTASLDAPDPVMQAAQFFWNTALSEARSAVNAQLAAEAEALRARRQSLDEAEQALAQREVAMQAQLDTATAALALAHQQLDDARQREEAARKEQSEWAQQHEQQRCALDAARAQIDEIRAAGDQERRENEASAQARERHWLNEVDRLRQDLGRSQKTTKELEQDVGNTRQALSKALADHADAMEQCETERHTRLELIRQRDAAVHDNEATLNALRCAQGDVERLQGALAEARRQRLSTSSPARLPQRKRSLR
jgi:DNA repair exonuclease SbcCD ATPase subunit